MNHEQELQIVESFANQLSLHRLKTEGLLFDRDYRRNTTTGQMELVSVKAVVTTHGKTTKVAFGEGEQYATYEEAVEGTKAHWREYFKQRRQLQKTAAAKAGARRRQQHFRDKKKRESIDISHRQ